MATGTISSRRALVPALLPALLCAVLVTTGCGGGGSTTSGTPSASGTPSTSGTSATSAAATVTGGGYDKVMVVVEENRAYGDIIGSAEAPYLNELARRFGSATGYDAGYRPECPSLAGYILLTSGADHGICDDDDPSAHPLTGDNVFQQVATAGKEWRLYADSMPSPCLGHAVGTYLVKHTPAPYYVSERARCAGWDVPLGSFTTGALHDAVTGGRLPALSLVIPDACHDMHGGHGCNDDHLITQGDDWLRQWLPAIMAGPDYRGGHLVVIITWDESSSSTTNHIPTLVISPTTQGVQDPTPQTHCTSLRTVEDLLHLTPLGCAADVAPFSTRFGLR